MSNDQERRDEAHRIMYQAGRQAYLDGAPAPGEYCVEGDAYRAGWYDADDERETERAALRSMPRGFCTSGGGI